MSREFKQAYQLQEGLDLIGPWGKVIDGDYIRLGSLRLFVFKHLGHKCVACGLEGAFWRKERDAHSERFFMQLYGVTRDGGIVLMTKDHIRPASKGGKNYAGNMQTMCATCNNKKGDLWIDMPIQAPTKKGHWDDPVVVRPTITSNVLTQIELVRTKRHQKFVRMIEKRKAKYSAPKPLKDRFINWLNEWRF
jgi:hypothetical protein